MRYWLIANAAAGNGTRGVTFWLDHLRTVGLEELDVRDLSETTWEAEVAAGDRLIVAGGDGTVSHVAKLCVERGATLAVLPSGTANDFARNLALPSEPVEICRLAAWGREARVDVAWVNDRLFLNVAHIGLGTIPVKEASMEQKARFGRFSYLAVLAQKMGLYRGFHGRIVHDGGSVEGRWLTIAIASGAFFGGGHRVAETAIDDGMLDIVAIRPRSWLHLLWIYLVTQLSGSEPQRDSAVAHLKTRQCHIQLRQFRTLTADGEVVERTLEARALTQPGALSVICGREAPR